MGLALTWLAVFMSMPFLMCSRALSRFPERAARRKLLPASACNRGERTREGRGGREGRKEGRKKESKKKGRNAQQAEEWKRKQRHLIKVCSEDLSHSSSRYFPLWSLFNAVSEQLAQSGFKKSGVFLVGSGFREDRGGRGWCAALCLDSSRLLSLWTFVWMKQTSEFVQGGVLLHGHSHYSSRSYQ